MQNTTNQSHPIETTGSPGLVDATRLLETLWPNEACRPSLRWLREQQSKRLVPFLKIGHKVFFVVDKVRRELERKFTIQCVSA